MAMKARECLEMGRQMEQQIRALNHEIEDIEEMARSLSSPDFDEHFNPNRAQDAPFAGTVEKIDELMRKRDALVARYLEYRACLAEPICRVTSRNGSQVLSLRYLKGESWENIAAEFGVDTRTARRWHDIALREFVVPKEAEKWKMSQNVTECPNVPDDVH